MNGVGLFFLLLLLLVILPACAWVGYTFWRARSQGLPPPPLSAYIPFKKSSSSNYPIAPRPGGIGSWFSDKFSALRNSRRNGGSYESTNNPDADTAWDARVGRDEAAYGYGAEYEEQELGLHPPSGPYGGSGYGRDGYEEEHEERGRSRSRDDGRRDNSTAYAGARGYEADERENPFGERAERSDLRGVSPRPSELEDTQHVGKMNSKGSGGGHERKSMFREAM